MNAELAIWLMFCCSVGLNIGFFRGLHRARKALTMGQELMDTQNAVVEKALEQVQSTQRLLEARGDSVNMYVLELHCPNCSFTDRVMDLDEDTAKRHAELVAQDHNDSLHRSLETQGWIN